MVEWTSPKEVLRSDAAFSKLMHVLLGLYFWEYATSLNFELDLFRGKKRFQWPLIFYFTGRYSLLFALLGIVVSLNVTIEINCQALYVFNQVFGNVAIGIASINLSLRTIAIWSRSIFIVVPTVCLVLGHWSLLLHGLLIKAAWIPTEGGCVITKTNSKVLAATFIYSMAFDFIVLMMTGYKLAFPISAKRIRARSTLVRIIFADGLIFFIVAFLANLIATIFMLMDLNAVMSIICNVPAAIASTIVASRAVRRLTNFASKNLDFDPTGQNSSLRFGTSLGGSRGGANRVAKQEGVHIQMNTFMLRGHVSGVDTPSFVEGDDPGRVKKKDSMESYDIEAQ